MKKYLFILSLLQVTFLFLYGCAGKQSVGLRDLADLADQYKMLPQYSGQLSNDPQMLIKNDQFEADIFAAEPDYQGITIPTESAIDGVEVGYLAEVKDVKPFYPGINVVLDMKLVFTKQRAKEELNKPGNVYSNPHFIALIYADNEIIGYLSTENLKWDLPEGEEKSISYRKDIPKDTKVYMTSRLFISVHDAHVYDKMTKIVIVDETNPEFIAYIQQKRSNNNH